MSIESQIDENLEVDPSIPRIPPIHPGEILKRDWLVPLGISSHRLAKALHVPPNRITGIINGTRGITANTAIRLGIYFSTDPYSWLNLQRQYDLEIIERNRGDIIRATVKPLVREVDRD